MGGNKKPDPKKRGATPSCWGGEVFQYVGKTRIGPSSERESGGRGNNEKVGRHCGNPKPREFPGASNQVANPPGGKEKGSTRGGWGGRRKKNPLLACVDKGSLGR